MWLDLQSEIADLFGEAQGIAIDYLEMREAQRWTKKQGKLSAKREQQKVWEAEQKKDPGKLERLRERGRKASNTYYHKHKEDRLEIVRAQNRKTYAKCRADPVRWAKALASARARYHAQKKRQLG